LSEKLLQLARAEAGQGLVREPVAVNALAREEMEELEPLFAAKGLRLRLEPSPQALIVLGDRLALGLALRNLLENALKFTPAGEVRFSIGQEGAWARLEISDGGPGIPQEALPHLFERFYQANVKHRQGGSGLGLALVAAIARWHGGEVSAANQRSGGARFTLRLPLLEAPELAEVGATPNLGCF
jgi:signal transduction histidine kinase